MKQYNPIYLCFCKATGRKPEDTTTYHFTGWVMEQQKIYMQERGIKGHFPEAHTDAFHVWLKTRYLIQEGLAPELADAVHAWLKKKWLGDGAK